MAHSLEIGIGVADISPEPGEGISGYIAREQTSVGSRAPLTLTALAARSGADTVAVLSADLLGAEQAFAEELRASLAAAYGLAAEGIAFASVHTHAAPALGRLRHMGEASEAYRRRVLAAAREALGQALADLRPASLAVGRGHVEGASHNRRDPSGPLDTECIVLRAERSDSTTIRLVQWQCHAVCFGADNRLTSPDYVGPLRAALKREDPQSAVIFFNGCFGDINPTRGNEEGATATGEAVAAAVLAMECSPLGGGPVRGAVRRITLPLRRDMGIAEADAHVAEWSRQAAEAPEGDQGRAARAMLDWAEELARRVRANDLPPDPVADVQVIRIGEAALCFLPCEPLCTLGASRKARSPWATTIPVGCANGVVGYVGPREAFDRAGYEMDVASRYYGLLPFEPGCGEMVLETALDLLGEVR